MKHAGCELCGSDGGMLVLSNDRLRVVLVDDADFPGFARVIWNDHVREMTELDAGSRHCLMQAVFAVESAQRETLAPAKINLASLGNVTPHLHWHVIPRFIDDSHFPQPVWGTRQRTPAAGIIDARRAQVDRLRWRIAETVARIARP
ncbi:MAG: HIT family protein [Burkholderiaceae bacterium]|jgi:diadenosine tetraphosphate (Ap4A) HIT family hydrolase|nr:HIT family protein [Burkholderiaceae bacterium]MDH5207406.1 HIT family protein [Burkholderiaceae bacterium]